VLNQHPHLDSSILAGQFSFGAPSEYSSLLPVQSVSWCRANQLILDNPDSFAETTVTVNAAEIISYFSS